MATTYSIAPNPASVNENAGTQTFTITRSNSSAAATVYASTVQDQGFTNNNDYTGIANQAISFAAGQSQATVSVHIDDLGLTSGSETFRFIVQQNASDPTSTYLAAENFSINNDDQSPSTDTISPNPASVDNNDTAVSNPGNILVDGTLAVDVSSLTLNGTGTVTLTGGTIEGSISGETLHNAGNTISGTGTIGDGSGHLAMDNASGTIEASGGLLVLDTGTAIINAGVLEAASGAKLQIDDPVVGAGSVSIGTGATVELVAADSGSVTFNGPTGTLILDDASTFSGLIHNFTGNGTLSSSDLIDLRNLVFGPGTTASYAGNIRGGILTVSDAQHDTANISLVGNYTNSTFSVSSDGHGGTLVVDPPAASYTPLANEVVISGLNIVSGGHTWAGETVVIPLTVSDPSQFYVKSDTDGSLIQVDSTTAAQLYAASIAIKDLNTYYGGLDVENVPSADWTPVLTSVENVLSLQSLSDLLAGSIPDILADDVDLEGVALTLVETASSFGKNDAELALTNSVLNDSKALLSSSYSDYQKYIETSNQGINFFTLQDTLNNTLLSLDTGTAAMNAISDVANLSSSIWDDISTFAATVFKSGLETVLSEISPVTGALIAPIVTGFDLADDSIDLNTFETSLRGLIDAAQTAETSSSPFSAAAIANDKSKLVNSIAETQGETWGSANTPIPSPLPVVSAKASGNTQVNAPLALHLLFTPSITPSGTSDAIDHFTLINTLQGPGELVINNVAYSQGEIANVTPAQFQTAYFTSSQSGTDEIAIIAFDSARNSSNLASTTITVSASSSPTPSPSDLKVSTASLVSSSLVAGGGGTVAFSVENLGTSPAPGTALSQIYLSTNTTVDSSDILVSPGAISDTGLGAGASQSEQLPFILPSNLAGSYYLIVFAGDPDQVTNGAAAGKTYATPITVATTAPSPSSPTPTSSQPSGANPLSIATDVAITTRVGSEPVITSSALHAVDTQYSNDTDLRYTIVTPPAYGHLIDNFYTTSTFTQADIDNELVDYVQNGTAVSSDSFSFYVSDPAGYRSPVETFTFNILPSLSPPPAPAPPYVTVELANDTGLPPEGGGPAFSSSDAALSGTANPGETVELTDGSSALGSAIADSAGNWTFSPSNGFVQGGHYITASVTISGQTANNYLSFDYDTIAPSAPSVPQLALGGNVADTATPSLSGTAEANDEVLLLEGNSVVGSGIATPGGTWTVATGALGLGYHSISAESIDPAGNISPLSGTDTIDVVPPPPGEVTLNDATMIGAGDLAPVGSVSAPSGTPYAGTVTEYGGPITADGFTLTDLSRSAYSFISWNYSWAFTHDVGGVGEYYDGDHVLIVPTNFLTESPSQLGHLDPTVADTIDLKRADGTAFSLVSIDVGPTGNYPTSAVFTGTTAAGQTITETVELNLPQNSPLQPVALTGFNDVTDVKFTERFSGSGDPTSIEFDNIVVGSATPAPSTPAVTPLLAPVTLDDATMVNAGDLSLVSTDTNIFTKGVTYEYGPITADGFTITNLDRSDFNFSSYNSSFAALNDDSYNGPGVLTVPIGQNFTPACIEIQRQDGGAFGIDSIALDTQLPTNPGNDSVTFTGITPSGNSVTQTFQLDNAQGLQTFQFGPGFDDLSSLQFVGSAGSGLFPIFQFDDIVLSPPVPPAPSGLAISSSSDSGIQGDNITNVSTPEITGVGEVGDNVSLFDGSTIVATGSVGANGSWAITTNTLADGSHSLTAIETNAAGNLSGASAPLVVVIDTVAPALAITSTGGVTTQTAQTISGTIDAADAGLTVSIYDGTTLLGTVTPAANGTWSEQVTLVATQGAQSITAQATDAAGNVGTSSSVTYTLDTLVPSVTAQSVYASENQIAYLSTSVSNPNHIITEYLVEDLGGGSGHLTVGGIAESDGQWIQADSNWTNVQYVGGSSVGTDTLELEIYDSTIGSFIGSPTFTATTTVAPSVTAQSFSVSENQSVAISNDFSVSNPSGDSITQYWFWDGGTGNGHFTVAGTTEPDGQWIVVSAGNLSSVQYVGGSSPGSETLYVELYDATTGSWPAQSSFTATTTAPPIVSSVTSSAGAAELDAGKVVTFTLNISEAVTVNTAGGAPTLALNDNEVATYTAGSGTSALTFAYTVKAGDNINDLQATALNVPTGSTIEDSFGSKLVGSATDNTGLVIDTTAPSLAITSTGVLSNQTMQTISGTIDAADAGLTVSIYDGATLLGTVTPAGNGAWSKAFTLLSTQGAQAITAQATDAAGNVGTSGSVTYTLDTVPPTLTISSTGGTSNQTMQTISGTIDSADAGLSVSIYDGTTLLGTVTPAGNGNWSKSVTLLSTQGAQAITAQATDAAGNVGTSSAVTYTVVESNGATSLVQAGSNYFLDPSGGSSGPELKYGGAPVTAGEFGGWLPIGAVQTASGYDIAWESPGANEYTVWSTNSSGNYIANLIGGVPGTSYALQAIELTFNQDLNSDGVIGPFATVIHSDSNSFGTTSLVEVGNSYALYASNGSGPVLQYGGAPVTAGEFGGWLPIGAVQTASGYDIAWESPGANEYTVWSTNSSGNYLTSLIGSVPGTSYALQAIEPTFNQDLNGDGAIGPLVSAGATFDLMSAYTGLVKFAASTGTLQLDNSLGFSGTVIGMSGQDIIDLKDINFSTVHTPVYSGTSTGGTLTVTDGTHTAEIALSGNYLASSFVTSTDGAGGVDVVDPPTTASLFGTSVTATATGVNLSGTIAFAAVDASHILTANVVPNGSNYAGTFSLGAASADDGHVSVGFEFSLGNDQINLPPDQTLTQSYNVNLVDPQNPIANMAQTVAVSIGGPGNDNFAFHPGVGADTITNFNPQYDTIELDNFANVQTLQQLQSLVASDAHGDAFIDLGHGDSITFAGTTAAQLQAVLQHAVHLH